MVSAGGGILIGGCGSGKTNCGIEIIHRIGKNALWLCHTGDLLEQTKKRVLSLYPNMSVGTITEGKVNMVQDGITISTVQTLVNVDPEVYRNNFEVVVVDEAHHISGSPQLQKMFVKVISKIPAKHKYGLTATKKRNDSLTPSIYANTSYNLAGESAPVWEIARSDARTLTAEHIRVSLDTPFSFCMLNDDGTFNYNALMDYIANDENRNETICKKIVEVAKEGRKQLVLAARIEQCKLINEKLNEMGLSSKLLIGNVKKKTRTEVLEQKVDWDVIVATVSLAKEGLDVTNLDTLHLISCISNQSDTVQSVGRIERVCEGKKQPIVYDYVDEKIPYLVSKFKKRVGWLKRR